jgi:hypothetical protein
MRIAFFISQSISQGHFDQKFGWYNYLYMLTRYGQKNAVWIDLVAPTPAEVRGLMHEYGIDPLIAEELLVPSFKPKVERRGEVIYVILHFPVMRGMGQRSEQEIDFVIGKDFLITTRYNTVDPLHAFAQAFEVNTVLGRPIGISTADISLPRWHVRSMRRLLLSVTRSRADSRILRSGSLAAASARW